VAALRCDGVTAPFVIDKAITGDIFRAYVRQFLLPTLRKGDIVIMDNLSAHKVHGIAEAIESAGARVQYLPPYSPDLNPIEMLFAKLKALLRKAKTRSIDSLWQCIAELLDSVTGEECFNYFKHDGYGAT
jgi:transposase